MTGQEKVWRVYKVCMFVYAGSKLGGVLLSIREIALDFALSKRFKSVLHCYIGNKMKLGTHITEQIMQRLMPEGHLLIYPLDFPLFSSVFNQDNIIAGQN